MCKPIKYGASWKSEALVAANVAVEVFSAALNARGAVVYGVDVCSYSSVGWSVPSLIAKETAPVGVVDGDVLVVGGLLTSVTGGYSSVGKLDRPVFIKPGKGLYFISKMAEVGTIMRVIYDLL